MPPIKYKPNLLERLDRERKAKLPMSTDLPLPKGFEAPAYGEGLQDRKQQAKKVIPTIREFDTSQKCSLHVRSDGTREYRNNTNLPVRIYAGGQLHLLQPGCTLVSYRSKWPESNSMADLMIGISMLKRKAAQHDSINYFFLKRRNVEYPGTKHPQDNMLSPVERTRLFLSQGSKRQVSDEDVLRFMLDHPVKILYSGLLKP